MKIRVAYDISFFAKHYNSYNFKKAGIFRAIEELVSEMSSINDVELTLMWLCDKEPLPNSHTATNIKTHKKFLTCKFVDSFSSLVLVKIYRAIYSIYYSNFQEKPNFYVLKLLERGLKKVLLYSRKLIFSYLFYFQNFDIFHSSYLQLPPQNFTKNIPRVLTVYDLIPIFAPEFANAYQTSFLKKVLNSINTQKDWIVCISEYTKQEFCQYTGMSPDRVFVAPLAAASHFYYVRDTDRISAVRQRYHIPDSDYFLSLAAPQPRKNLVHLIRCFFRLLSEKQEIDVNLVLVGSKDLGWMHDDIFAAAESSPLFRSRVIFTGYIPDDDLSEIYSGAKVFIFPSLYEGFGLPPLEAMQCGTPVIASNTTSLPEVVGDAGILVDPKDEDSLCQAMLDILNNAALGQELSRKGLERAAQFSWAKCAADTLQVYKTALSG